jgi:CelD/BcsL family acetyltransferase involved in cellulose biosynthesis
MTLPEGPLTPEIVFRGRPFKKRMRSFRRRLEESGTVTDFVPDTAEGSVELLKWLLTMQELRFERLGRKPSMPMADMLAFHSSIIREPSPGVAADVRGLAMDGKVIAALYGLRAGEKYFQIITAMDEEWAKLAPGLVLMWRTVEAMQRAGCRRYDFTIGDEDYKQDFATECVPIMEMMKPLSLTSLPAISWYAAHPKLVAAKRTLAAQEHPIMKSINKLLSR